jgi:hypothetical protein
MNSLYASHAQFLTVERYLPHEMNILTILKCSIGLMKRELERNRNEVVDIVVLG